MALRRVDLTGFGRASVVFVVLGCVAVLVTRPLWPERILATQTNDLANHVRHVSEYRAALAEGQFPPLTAPHLNDSTRIPLFQYYSGTAYTLPGVLAWVGVPPYRALKISVGAFSLLAGFAAFGACRILTGSRAASLVAAVAFQLAPFGAVDLHNRGAFPEWVALQWLPVILFVSLRLAESGSPVRFAGRTLLAFAAWAFFIPIHPSQTVYAGPVVFGIALLHGFRATGWAAVWRLLIATSTAALASSWFWVPIAQGTGHLRIGGHLCFLNAWFTWPLLLSPRFQDVPELHGWAPQVGVHFVVAAVVCLIARPWRRPLAWLCGTALLGSLAVIMFGPTTPWLAKVFSGLQWNYRLLIPGAILGAVGLALALTRAEEILRPRLAACVQLAVLAFVVWSAVPYFNAKRISCANEPHGMLPAEVLSETYSAPNSSYYAFRGMDVRSLGWVRNGRLATNADLPVPVDAVPLAFELSLPPGTVGEPRWFVNGQPRAWVAESAADGARQFRGEISPRCGLKPEGDVVVRFELPGEAPKAADLRFHAGDGKWFRSVPEMSSAGNRFDVTVPAAGLYQLPVHYTPLTRVTVNGTEATHQSADRYMEVVPLEAGRSEVRLAQRWHPITIIGTVAVALFWIAVFALPRVRVRIFGEVTKLPPPDAAPVVLARAA